MAAIDSDKDSRTMSYILMNDLTLDNWTPISSFSGVFNGNGHTITLSIDAKQDRTKSSELMRTASVGLFRIIYNPLFAGRSLVMNLHVTGSIVSTHYENSFTTNAVGGIAGCNHGRIVNCSSSVSLKCEQPVTKTILHVENLFVGGIAGINHGEIANCYATGDIEVSGDAGKMGSGIVGYNRYLLVNSYATGIIYVHDLKSKNSYYRHNWVIYRNIGGDDKRTEPDDVVVDSATMHQREWWENVPKFAFGQTNDAPWIWDETRQRPVLYWEKFDVAPMPFTKNEAAAAKATQTRAAKEGAAEGYLTPDITWRIEDATLIVSGTGEIPGAPIWSSKMDIVTSVIIGDGITKLGHHAFNMNKNITRVILGKDLTDIGTYAFFNCDNLAVMEVRSTTPPKVGAFAFMSTPVGKAILIVPAGTKAAYEANKNWKKFGTIEEN
jgi:hypothetical protein